MAQPSSGNAEGNPFGSPFGTAAPNANVFGTQTVPSPNLFGTFGGQISPPSSTFGSFGGHTSPSSTTFGTVPGFGTTSSGFTTSTQAFRGTSGSAAFGGSAAAPVFGAQTSTSMPQSFGATSSANLFGTQTVFGSSARSGGQSSVPLSTTSHSFGGTGSASSNLFGSTPSTSATFGGAGHSSSSAFSTNVFSSSAPFGPTSSSSTQPVFSMKSAPQVGNAAGAGFSAASGFPMQSAKLFGFSTPSTSEGSTSTGSGFGNQSSSGVRKRNSSGAVSNASLFKNPGTSASSLFGTASVSLQGQNAPFSTTATLFSGTGASTSSSGQTLQSHTAFTGTSQPQALFGKKQDSSEPSSDKMLFGKPDSNKEQSERVDKSPRDISYDQSSLGSTGQAFQKGTDHGHKQVLFASDQQASSSHSSLFPVASTSSENAPSNVREVPAYSNTLFGTSSKGKDSGPTELTSVFGKSSEKVAATSQSQTLFGQPGQASSGLFGTVPSRSSASSSKLFGDQGSKPQNLFGKDQSSVGLFQVPKTSGLSRTASSFNLMDHGGKEGQRGFSPDRGDPFKTGQDDPRQQERSMQDNRAGEEEDSKNSPRKSLSRWSRGRDVPPERKKRELPSSSQSELRESKKSRIPMEQEEATTSSSSPRRRLSSMRQSVDDPNLRTSLIVKNIPQHLNNGTTLRRHFSQFGTITRLQPLTVKKAANITFKTHEEALRAKNEGTHLDKRGPPLSIFWRAVPATKSPEGKPVRSREDVSRRVPKKSLTKDSVEDELASMAGPSDYLEEFLGSSRRSSEVSRLDHELQKSKAARKRSPTPPPATLSIVQPQISSSSSATDFETAKDI